MSAQNIVVIGAGAWGTALAQAAALAGNQVTLLGRDQTLADRFNTTHCNVAYLGDQKLSERIFATIDAACVGNAQTVLVAVPAQKTRAVLAALPEGVKNAIPVIATAKGFEAGTLALQSAIIAESWRKASALVLSGPSFAVDVAAGRPTAVTLAGDNEAITTSVAEAMSGPTFRLYRSSDVHGVELAGGLKNVYALACGAVEGAQLGLSARSALIARAHAEMTRLILARGGILATGTGLAGLGDLALSCTSVQSRNYRFGVELGRGHSVAQVLEAEMGLAEGVTTAPVALEIAQQSGIDAPLVAAVSALLNGDMDIAELVRALMARPLKKEY